MKASVLFMLRNSPDRPINCFMHFFKEIDIELKPDSIVVLDRLNWKWREKIDLKVTNIDINLSGETPKYNIVLENADWNKIIEASFAKEYEKNEAWTSFKNHFKERGWHIL